MPESLYYYGSIVLALLGAGIGLPYPEEVPVVVGGALVAIHDLRWWIMLPLCIVSVVVIDGMLYGVGRLWGPRLLQHRFIQKQLPPERVERIQRNFHQYGIKILLFSRVLPGIRSPLFIVAGIMRLSLTKFLIADCIYAIPGISLLFWLGWWFGDQYQVVVNKVDSVRPLIILLAITALGAFLLVRVLRRPVATGGPEDLPPLVREVAIPAENGDTPAPAVPSAAVDGVRSEPTGSDTQHAADTLPVRRPDEDIPN